MRTLVLILLLAGIVLTVIGMVLLMFPQVVQDEDGSVWAELLDRDITDLWKKPILGTILSVSGSLCNSAAAILAFMMT